MSEIVGVVARMRFHAIDEMAPLPVIYCPTAQAQRTSLGLFVRSTLSSAALGKSIRDAAASIDPNQPVYDAKPMLDRVHESWGAQRLLSFLFSFFAGLALVLATIGLYGYSLTSRSNVSVKSAFGSRLARAPPKSALSSFARVATAFDRFGDWPCCCLCAFARTAKRAF
jgi:hypothetical protein